MSFEESLSLFKWAFIQGEDYALKIKIKYIKLNKNIKHLITISLYKYYEHNYKTK